MILTDGGIETRILYEFKRPLTNFGAFALLSDTAGREILRAVYASYARVGAERGMRMQLGTPTWRASRAWGADAVRVNRDAVDLLCEVIAASGVDGILTGVIGPHGDGYDPAGALNAESAYAYHAEQAEALAASGVSRLYAPTFPAFEEALGVARAMARTGLPYALAPMIAPQGRMIDGTPLGEAIARIDAVVSPAPSHYVVGCLYPTLAAQALRVTRASHPAETARVRGLKANASPLSAAELEQAGHLEGEPVAAFARDAIACAREFDLDMLGGCCGTDDRHIAAIAASLQEP